MRFDEKVAIVTGAGSGIGRATALAFAREGAQVTLADNNRDAGEDAVREVIASGGEAIFIHADVSSEVDADRIVDQTVTAFGGLDILHNNAGIMAFGSSTDLSVEDWNRVIATNLTGAFLCSRSAIPPMKKRGGGVIINTASTQAFGNRPNGVAYGVSKAAIVSLTRSLALDHGRDGIRAVAVAPGPVDTPMLRRAAQVASPGDPDAAMRAWADHQPSGRVATAEDVAATILFLASPEADYVTGRALVVDGGMLAGLG